MERRPKQFGSRGKEENLIPWQRSGGDSSVGEGRRVGSGYGCRRGVGKVFAPMEGKGVQNRQAQRCYFCALFRVQKNTNTHTATHAISRGRLDYWGAAAVSPVARYRASLKG